MTRALFALLLSAAAPAFAADRALLISVADYPQERGYAPAAVKDSVDILADALRARGFDEESLRALRDDAVTRAGLDEAPRAVDADSGSFFFLDAPDGPGAARLSGSYQAGGEAVLVVARLKPPDGEVQRFEIRADQSDLEGLSRALAAEVERRLGAPR